MDEKKKKTLLLIIVAVCVVAIVVWIILSSPREKAYEYEGYVIDIRQSADNAVVTTISASSQSEFIITRKTKKEYKDNATTINIGDCIRLNTTKKSDTEVKEFLAFSAFSMEGKIVNVEGNDTPVFLTINSTNAFRSYRLVPAKDSIPAMATGTTVKIYYQYPLNNGTEQIVADVIQPISDIISPLTEAEIGHIEKIGGYTIAEETAK